MENENSKPQLKPNSKSTSINNKTNSTEPIDFLIAVPNTDYQDDDYGKIIEKEIEDQCQFKNINKLELDDVSDEELIEMNKEDIILFKNKQIAKLKAYIVSLEHEKEVLIENYSDSTSLLLERIKDIEFQNKGIRPETPMIAKSLLKKSGGVTQNDFKSLKAKKTIERCPNCRIEFPKEQFVAHSLQCLRKVFNCKVCNQLVNETNKVDHLNKYRSPQAMMKAVKDNDEKLFQLGIGHGYKINSLIDTNKDEAIIHVIAKTDFTTLMNIVLKDKLVNKNLVNKNKETPLLISLEHKCEAMALFLLDKEVDFKIRNKGDMSPLMLSCKYGLTPVVNRLLALGEDLNEKNILGETALKIAQSYHQDSLGLKLLEFNTQNLKQKNKKKNI